MKLSLKNPSDYGRCYMQDIAASYGLECVEEADSISISSSDSGLLEALSYEIEMEVGTGEFEDRLEQYYDDCDDDDEW